MSALAEYLSGRGVNVTGCDAVQSFYTRKLASLGVKVGVPTFYGAYDDLPLVVINSAIRPDNAELTKAVAKGCRAVRREEVLGAVFNSYPVGVAVCGTHGKTTTAAMITHGLAEAGLSPTAFVGGVMKDVGSNFLPGEGDICVAEACEYKAGFLTLTPTVNCMLDVDYDHADFYKDKEAAALAFRRFSSNTRGKNIVNGDDPVLKTFDGLKFGFGDGNNYRGTDVWQKNGFYTFSFVEYGKTLFIATLAVPGRHNVLNALCACAALRHIGLGGGEIKRAVETFGGVDRRFTVRKGKFFVVTDYAHHPAEIAAALETAAQSGFDKIRLVFQPHTYTRTKAFFDDFSRVLRADEVYILPTYAAREEPIAGYESKDLAAALKDKGVKVFYVEDTDALAETLIQKSAANDAVLLVGAGDVDLIKDKLP